mmetsp:Transcript_1812/g.1992  ORF Transcript_1812/g.1992 Transcript_1812/m.1992 type:complete len:157 (+) Transcript_1812:123-593(+)
MGCCTSSDNQLNYQASWNASQSGDSSSVQRLGRFEHLTEDDKLYQCFLSYLLKEFAEENLLFYMRVHKFQHTQFANETQMSEEARSIADDFLGTGSKIEILNVRPDHKREIVFHLYDNSVTSELFYAAKVDIETMLRTKYLRFCEQDTLLLRTKEH